MPDSGGIMQLKKEYDVFIAYHGSYEADGSARTADRIYSYLTGKGIKCFYFPRSAKDAYKANIIEVMKSRLFLFVCNTGVHTDDSKRLDPKRHYELSTEIDAFYALTQLGDAAVKDAKIYACGDMRKGDEACLHELFSNRTHFYESGDEANDFSMIYDWAAHRLENAVSWNETQITSEIKEVFATRASMNQSCRFDDLVATAKCVRDIQFRADRAHQSERDTQLYRTRRQDRNTLSRPRRNVYVAPRKGRGSPRQPHQEHYQRQYRNGARYPRLARRRQVQHDDIHLRQAAAHEHDIRRRLSDIAVLFQQRPGHKQPVVLYRKASRVARVRIFRKVVQLP